MNSLTPRQPPGRRANLTQQAAVEIEARRTREAEALRENLKKRKLQARDRVATAEAPTVTPDD